MKAEECILYQKGPLTSRNVYASIDSSKEWAVCLCDPITQLCKRIEAFFKRDPEVHCKFIVNNNADLGPKLDPDTGEQMTRMIELDGETKEVYLEEDHVCELRVFCDDLEKAQCLSNVIRHRHVIPEFYDGTSDDHVHLRNHHLMVRVFSVDAVDPMGDGSGSDPWITGDNTDSGVHEIFGLEPISWDETEGYGCIERLDPYEQHTEPISMLQDPKEDIGDIGVVIKDEQIPVGFPEEWEQHQWEEDMPGLAASAWKWKWIKSALKGNKNVVDMSFEFNDGMNTWRFIECNDSPVVFLEDNLTSARGYNSILPADLLPVVFSIFGKFQISTHVRKLYDNKVSSSLKPPINNLPINDQSLS